MVSEQQTSSIEIGRRNLLRLSRLVSFGAYLEDSQGEQILLPKKYLPADLEVGSLLDVFVYTDSEDRPVAVTDHPKVMVGGCAYLEVVASTRIGAFLDWGLEKDLLVPARQQARDMRVGEKYVVYAYLDQRTNRIAASSKLSLYLKEVSTSFYPGQDVQLLIADRTKLGYKAIINGSHLGVIFNDEVKSEISIGQNVPGSIKRIRKEDGRIDLAIVSAPPVPRRQLHDSIIHQLRLNGGVSLLTDKSSPEAVFEQYGVSKGAYKKALGALYKDRRISIEKDRIVLNSD
ncbi:MAG: S1-like domain-containing RNA-binding protein [Pseudomonadota bacterium]